jgi:serine/threonine protein kinase
MAENDVPTCVTTYAGLTAKYYQRLADAGLAPKIIRVTENEIEAVKHTTLTKWLSGKPSKDERQVMKEALVKLLRAAHETGICHRDVHICNIVLRDDGRPLLIDPALAAENVNEHCYHLEGPEVAGVPIPQEHLEQDGDERWGVWWGSPVKYRSLEEKFGHWASVWVCVSSRAPWRNGAMAHGLADILAYQAGLGGLGRRTERRKPTHGLAVQFEVRTEAAC